jgi:integrase
VVNELGVPYRPEWFADQFRSLANAAGLPAIQLHDARHTCGTLMHLRGVPPAVISKWLGHSRLHHVHLRPLSGRCSGRCGCHVCHSDQGLTERCVKFM